ncbi:ribonuclease PH [Nitriliruptoraceae bacterium ZYF776]|nr:ribonuclease PH [Profundirhabdus halotolerans]
MAGRRWTTRRRRRRAPGRSILGGARWRPRRSRPSRWPRSWPWSAAVATRNREPTSVATARERRGVASRLRPTCQEPAVPRPDGRADDQLRPLRIAPDAQRHPAGSALIEAGGTRVLCAASVEDGAPRFRDRRGWVTAEYAMLPGSTDSRSRRERQGPGGRSKEIERLIGRSLRAVVDLDALPDATVTVDCDVLEADGGTRTAAITGGWVALARALRSRGWEDRLTGQVAAVSVGIVDGTPVLDLPYEEDHRADVDMNVVATADGRLVEVQGTAEGAPFGRAELDRLLDLALAGCERLFVAQREAVAAGSDATDAPVQP